MKVKEFKDHLVNNPTVTTFYCRYQELSSTDLWYSKIVRVGDRFKDTSFHVKHHYVSTSEQTTPPHTLAVHGVNCKHLEFIDAETYMLEASKVIEELNTIPFNVELEMGQRIDCRPKSNKPLVDANHKPLPMFPPPPILAGNDLQRVINDVKA